MAFKKIGIGIVTAIYLTGCGGGISATGTSNVPLTVIYDRTVQETSTLTPQQQEIVDIHNQKRRGYYSDADLQYSVTLENAAQEYVNVLAQNGGFEHDPTNREKGYGENLYAYSADTPPNVNDVLTSWFDDEEPYYHYENGSCEEGVFPKNGQPILCGHYTQVLWQETTEVGCATAQYQTGMYENGYVYVCKYQKPGNVVGEKPYCQEYSNRDLYSDTLPSFLTLDLSNKSFPIELVVEDRTHCTRTSNMNSAIQFGSDLSSVIIEDFQIFNTESASVRLEFDKLIVGEHVLKLTGKNRHILDEAYRDKDIYMTITLTGETQEYYAVALDWNGYDAAQPLYSRQMRAKLYK